MANKNLEIVQGQTLAFGFEYEGTTQDLDGAYFTIKQDLDSSTALVQKTIGDGISKVATTSTGVQYRVRIAPEDTIGLEAGTYYYDFFIELNSDKFPILRGSIKLLRNVTYGGGQNG